MTTPMEKEQVDWEVLRLNPDEVVILSADYNGYTIDEVKNIFTTIKKQFPDNKVICIPSNIVLLSTSNREEYKKFLQQQLNELNYEEKLADEFIKLGN